MDLVPSPFGVCALVVKVALDLGAFRRQMKLGCDARDRFRVRSLRASEDEERTIVRGN
jgi:hypothetical protein